ncbi:hypothetical protein [Enterococcus rivorum]|uniref:Uncharacterized protein n=1 Tax=Enterococcus rivorum TaxID=762845 RepID=A0A1E5KVV1_9ENTE|nr:hypothetical protein [Enterococcus rivorum]MBP2098988.1 hypothetical protein [Enterococcus rivorum]OEH81997.1 hypothetical protein BCR26_15240 [Enterococcus rivorum]
MEFNLTILPNEFTENKLNVLSLVSLSIEVKDEYGIVVERIETTPSEKEYKLATELGTNMRVEVHLIPGQEVEFYPVVTAL